MGHRNVRTCSWLVKRTVLIQLALLLMEFGIRCCFFHRKDVLIFNDFVFCGCKKGVAIPNTYSSAGSAFWGIIFPIKHLLVRSDLVRHRGSVEGFVSTLGVISKGLQINDALYRPLYFVFKGLLGDQ